MASPALPWLQPGQDFPPTDQALTEPQGLLAVGGDLEPDTLARAYRRGIFPWFNDDQPILWWSPSPRMVLVPEEFHLSRSLARHLRRAPWRYSLDQCLARVVQHCAQAPGRGPDQTWITADMARAYLQLHQRGQAHSVEVWEQDELVGGLYGVHLGQMFFGESMFSLRSDASKAALYLLCRLAPALQVRLIDCQMHTPHLTSLGGRLLERGPFEAQLDRLCPAPGRPHWALPPQPLAECVRAFRLDPTCQGPAPAASGPA